MVRRRTERRPAKGEGMTMTRNRATDGSTMISFGCGTNQNPLLQRGFGVLDRAQRKMSNSTSADDSDVDIDDTDDGGLEDMLYAYGGEGI